MVGPVVRAGDVAKRYPGKSRRKGGKVFLKNSEGILRPLPESAQVYHRGKGRFARWDRERDRKVPAPVNNRDPKRIGSGSYIHAGDGRRLVEKGKKKSGGRKSRSKK